MAVLWHSLPFVSCGGVGASSRKEEPLAQVMKNDPKFGMRILGQEVGTKVLFKFLGGVVAVYAFLAPKLFERGDSE